MTDTTTEAPPKATGADLVRQGKAKAAKKAAKKPKAETAPAGQHVEDANPAALAISDDELKAMGLDPAIFAEGRLALPKNVSFERWSKVVAFLTHVDTEHRWWMGDAMRIGQDRWGNDAWGVFKTESSRYDETHHLELPVGRDPVPPRTTRPHPLVDPPPRSLRRAPHPRPASRRPRLVPPERQERPTRLHPGPRLPRRVPQARRARRPGDGEEAGSHVADLVPPQEARRADRRRDPRADDQVHA